MKFILFAIIASLLLIVNANNSTETKQQQTYCYVCNENEPGQEDCKDPFPDKSTYLQPCEVGEVYCRKTIQFVNDRETTARQCGREPYKGGIEGCYKTAGKATQHVCTCIAKTIPEGCNGASLIKASILSISSIILFKIIF